MKKLFFINKILFIILITFFPFIFKKNFDIQVNNELYSYDNYNADFSGKLYQNVFLLKKIEGNINILEIDSSTKNPNLSIFIEIKDVIFIQIINQKVKIEYQEKKSFYPWKSEDFSKIIYHLLDAKTNKKGYKATLNLNQAYEENSMKILINSIKFFYIKAELKLRIDFIYNDIKLYINLENFIQKNYS